MANTVSCSIDYVDGLAKLICVADGQSGIIDFQWDIILGGKVSGIHRLGYMESDHQHLWVADFFDSRPLSQIDAGNQCPERGILRIQQIIGVLLKAEDYLFNEYQAWLNPEAIRFSNSGSADETVISIVFLPLDMDVGNGEFSFGKLISQIATAYGIPEKQADLIMNTYLSDGMVRLDSLLAAEQIGSAGKPRINSSDSPKNFADLSDLADPANVGSMAGQYSDEISDYDTGSKKENKSAKYLWFAIHVIWLAAAGLILAGSELLNGLAGRSQLLIGILTPGILIASYDIRMILKQKQQAGKLKKDTPITSKSSNQKNGRTKTRKAGRSEFDAENQTEIVTKVDNSFRMAMLSQGLPGTPEELEGIRAFILLDEFIIGREESEADLWLSSSTVGRRHARICRREGTFFLTDLGSRNGTFLDGRRLNKNEECLLPDRCRLTFADQSYYFQAD